MHALRFQGVEQGLVLKTTFSTVAFPPSAQTGMPEQQYRAKSLWQHFPVGMVKEAEMVKDMFHEE